MSRAILCVLAAAGLSACYASAGVAYPGPYYGPVAAVPAPNLVSIGPGVSVIADYDQPIFYANNAYWRFNNGYWYSSPRYTGGWVYARPPAAVLGIRNPYAYRHYHPYGYRAYRYPVQRY